MFGDNSWREARVADPPHMLLAQALAPQQQQLSPRSAGNQLWPSLDDAPLSEDMLRLHSALHAPLPTCASVLTNYRGSLHMGVDPSLYTPQTDDVDPGSLETLARLAASRIKTTEGRLPPLPAYSEGTMIARWVKPLRIQQTEGTLPLCNQPPPPLSSPPPLCNQPPPARLNPFARFGSPLQAPPLQAASFPLVHVDAYGIKQPKEGRTKIADKGKGNPLKHDTGVQGVGITSCVLTAVQVVEIYSLLLDQTSVGSLALKYNVARTTINNIKNHTRWQVTTKHLWSNEDREAYDRTPKTLRGQKSVPWTEDEDNTLMIAVDQYGSRGMWTTIAKFLPERRPAQVHRRWKNHLQKSL